MTLLAYTYVSVPAPTAVVTTARLTRERKGVYGLHSVVKVPRIAGGAGSIVRANLSARRVYTYKGERRSVLSGRCPDGRIYARGTFFFRDGSQISGNLVRTCTTLPSASASLLLGLPSEGEEGPTREDYVAAVEPICKRSGEVSARILEGVRAKVKAGELEVAASQFSRAAQTLQKALGRLQAVPRPPGDEVRLTKWLDHLKTGVELLRSVAEKLRAGDKAGAQRMAVRLSHNATVADNQVLGFGFQHCRSDPGIG